MENFEIVISDILKTNLNKFIFNEIKNNVIDIRSSHFYNNEENKDLTLNDISDFEKILSPKGTGNIVLNSFNFNSIFIVDVVFVFSFNNKVGDIVINFPLEKNKIENDQEKIAKIVNYLKNLKVKYNIKDILFGYEADEENMIKLSNNKEDVDLETKLRKLGLINI